MHTQLTQSMDYFSSVNSLLLDKGSHTAALLNAKGDLGLPLLAIHKLHFLCWPAPDAVAGAAVAYAMPNLHVSTCHSCTSSHADSAQSKHSSALA